MGRWSRTPYPDRVATPIPLRTEPWWRPRPPVATSAGVLTELDPADLVALRRTVLRDGRDDLVATHRFDAEPTSLHLGVVAADGSAVGGVTVVIDPLPGFATLRLVLMAVDPAVQGSGVGRSLVEAIQDRAAEAGLDVWAAARVSAVDFYLRLGFLPRGDVFVGPMDLAHRRVLWRSR